MNASTRTASEHAAQVLPARAVLFLGIVGLHALLAYLFASGLITQTIKILAPDPFKLIDVEKKTPPPQPQPPPNLPPAVISAMRVDPFPIYPISMPIDPPLVADPAELPVITPAGPREPVAPPPLRLVGHNVMPNTVDYYPPSDIRMGYEGTTQIRSCVDTNGRLDGTPTVEATSGHASLDRAAVRLARDGSYARALRGDVPVPNCYRFRVTFTLR